MKRTFDLRMLAAVILAVAGAAAAQSLADVARQVRKQNAKKPPVKVYTNDNLPTQAPISVTGPAPATNATAANSDQSAQNAGDQKPAAEQRDEVLQQWKKRFADQKNKIALLQREMDVIQGEYRLRAAAYYADAGNALRNQAAWAQQSRDYKDKIDAKQKALEQAKQKLEDMQEEARKAGMPSSVSD